jgi:outer membrane lipopolysaccharide assembly protein LptE/RlpB
MNRPQTPFDRLDYDGRLTNSDLRSPVRFLPLRCRMTLRLSIFPFLGLGLMVTLISACSHYQLGTSGKLSFATLYILPVENRSLLPQSRAIVGTQIREAFERDGRVTLVNSAETADATLEVVIRDYHRDVASVQESDTGLARKFTLTLGVACTLRDQHGEHVLFTDRLISVQRDAFTDGGQLQSEYQTVPLLAEALAKKISHAVLDVW